jgi:hypothetical protein
MRVVVGPGGHGSLLAYWVVSAADGFGLRAVRVGLPLTVVIFLIGVILVPILWPFHP